MEVTFNSKYLLRLSVVPSTKSLSIFLGIISIGLGASHFSPDEHLLIKFAYISGTLFLGLTFLDDWENCVVDQKEKKVTLTRRNWFDILTSKCTMDKTLILDTSTILDVRVMPTKRKNQFKVGLVLRSGSVIPLSETTSSSKSMEEDLADRVRKILRLDYMEPVSEAYYDDSDDDSHSTVPGVENLKRSSYVDYDYHTIENEVQVPPAPGPLAPFDDVSDTSSSASESVDMVFFDQ